MGERLSQCAATQVENERIAAQLVELESRVVMLKRALDNGKAAKAAAGRQWIWGIAVPAAIAVLAAAAIVLALTDTLVAASWFGSTGRTWWPDALADQQRGGIAALAVVAVTAVNQAVQLGRRTAHTSSDPREPAAPERD